jgi:O-antigen ligase
VSTFLSPLATAYLLVVALVAVAAVRRPRWALAVSPLLFAALLWTHTRAAIFALAGALVVLALASRRLAPLGAAVLVAVVGAVFLHGYRHVAPRTHFTAGELRIQNRIAHARPGSSVSSNGEHASALREGLRRVIHHPQGYGVGNAGVSAQRTGVLPAAGESTYTELGVETGLVGGLVFVAWSLALFWRAVRRCPWVGAALAAILVIGVQTDVIGIPWIAVVLWALAGSSV